MSKLRRNIKHGFDTQLFHYIRGWNLDNEEFQFVIYFASSNNIKFMNRPKNGLPYTIQQWTNYNSAIATFLKITNNLERGLEIVDGEGNVTSADILNYISKEEVTRIYQ